MHVLNKVVYICALPNTTIIYKCMHLAVCLCEYKSGEHMEDKQCLLCLEHCVQHILKVLMGKIWRTDRLIITLSNCD